MATITQGSVDPTVEKIKTVLDEYKNRNPGAIAELYRQNSASVRVRIIDQHFAGSSKSERNDEIWDFLAAQLDDDDDTLQEISVLLLLAPAEQPASFMNFEFDDPIPSSF